MGEFPLIKKKNVSLHRKNIERDESRTKSNAESTKTDRSYSAVYESANAATFPKDK